MVVTEKAQMNKPRMRQSKASLGALNIGRRARDRYAESGVMTGGMRGYSDEATLLESIKLKNVRLEEERAQTGPVKVIFLDGLPVPTEQQLLSRAEIRRLRRREA